jgi:hypothetical protein
VERERAHPYRAFLHYNNGEDMAYYGLKRKDPEAAAKFRANQSQWFCDNIEAIGKEFKLVLGQTPLPGTKLLRASELHVVGRPEISPIVPSPSSVRAAERLAGRELRVRFTPAANGVQVEGRAILRDGANYIRQETTPRAGKEAVEVVEIVLLDIPAPGAEVVNRASNSVRSPGKSSTHPTYYILWNLSQGDTPLLLNSFFDRTRGETATVMYGSAQGTCRVPQGRSGVEDAVCV